VNPQGYSQWPKGLFLTLLALLVAGGGVFGSKDDELPPAELLKFKQELDLRKLWSAKVGGGSESLQLSLRPMGDGKRIYTASYDGVVSAFQAENGKQQWRVKLGTELSAGPGVGQNLVVVASKDGDIIALHAEDGSAAWQTNVSGESLSTPLVDARGVAVYTIDGRLRVLSVFDGSERWAVQQDLPALTLRGSSSPILVGDTLLAGFDNGRLLALDIDDGAQEWEAMIAPPSGRSDLERLTDLDGQLLAIGQDVYASGYHGRVAALAAESGQILWSREISTYAGIGADWNNVYVVDEEGALIALQRRNGSDVWRTDALLRRMPTAPVSFDLTVVVGDFEGYVHFFSNIDGRPVARVRVGSGAISDAPVVIDGRLYVQSENGSLVVYEVPKPKLPGDVAPTAKDST